MGTKKKKKIHRLSFLRSNISNRRHSERWIINDLYSNPGSFYGTNSY